MTRPLVSLVIATYNRARLLREALESVAASTITPSSSVEVIVVDNNSTDGTAAAIGSVRRDGFPFQLSYIKET
ncbi:MAG TPA: glycosyltransferase, partial [Gammaproteobacteria bacterium]|nr:glycosyltransferase [Gammaproteobacteria bacterium]